MAKKERIVSYSAKELKARRSRGESRTDWTRVKSMSQKAVDHLANREDGTLPAGWEKTVVLGLPPGKEAVKLRVDKDVLGWFKGTGKGYQTRMNNVLRAFVSSQINAEQGRRTEKR